MKVARQGETGWLPEKKAKIFLTPSLSRFQRFKLKLANILRFRWTSDFKSASLPLPLPMKGCRFELGLHFSKVPSLPKNEK